MLITNDAYKCAVLSVSFSTKEYSFYRFLMTIISKQLYN